MKLTKKQWETILAANGATNFEVFETPYGSFKFKFRAGTEDEFISDDLDVKGYFIVNNLVMQKVSLEAQKELKGIINTIERLTYSVSNVVAKLGATNGSGEIFMEKNILYYIADNGNYEKAFPLYEGKRATVANVDEIIESINSVRNHPLYVEKPYEDFELYREALNIAYEVNLIDNDFLVKFEDKILITYLEILVGEETKLPQYTKWEEVKKDKKLFEQFGSEKMNELVGIVETLKYLEAE